MIPLGVLSQPLRKASCYAAVAFFMRIVRLSRAQTLMRIKKAPLRGALQLVAEGGGFEPPEQFPVRQFSKLVVSATHPSLQQDCKYSILFFIISRNSASFQENRRAYYFNSF